MVEPTKNGEKFNVPMDLRKARDLSVMLVDTVMRVDPSVALELLGPCRRWTQLLSAIR
jgi:hypothetical protein